MAKKASKSVQRNNSQMRITVYYGYALFLLILAGLLLTLTPWVQLIAATQETRTVSDFSVAMLLVSFVFTALAPALVGYLAGDSATRSKNKLIHHYNGVLFGVLGVWLWSVLGIVYAYIPLGNITANTLQYALLNLAPTALAAITTIVLGIVYARSTRHQVSLIDYNPYRVLLIGAAAALAPSIALAAGLSKGLTDTTMVDAFIALIVPLLFMLVAVLVGYYILGKQIGTVGERIVRSIIAAGFAILAMTGVIQLITYTTWDPAFQYIAMGFATAVWLSYLLLVRRALKK